MLPGVTRPGELLATSPGHESTFIDLPQERATLRADLRPSCHTGAPLSSFPKGCDRQNPKQREPPHLG